MEHPGRRARHGVRAPRASNEVAVLKEFENAFDAIVNGTGDVDAGATRRWRSPASTSSADAVKRRKVERRAVPRQPPGPQGPRLAARDPRLARRRTRASRSAWRAPPATRPPASRRPTAAGRGPRLLRQQPVGELVPRLPAGELPHLGRLRLDDRDRRRPLGQPARRGQAVVDHRELRRAHRHLPGRRRSAAPTATSTANGYYADPVHGGTVTTHLRRLLAGLLQPDPRRRAVGLATPR